MHVHQQEAILFMFSSILAKQYYIWHHYKITGNAIQWITAKWSGPDWCTWSAGTGIKTWSKNLPSLITGQYCCFFFLWRWYSEKSQGTSKQRNQTLFVFVLFCVVVMFLVLLVCCCCFSFEWFEISWVCTSFFIIFRLWGWGTIQCQEQDIALVWQ